MKKYFKNIVIVVLFLAGFGLLIYPLAANQWNSYRQNQLTSDYKAIVDKMEEEGTIKYEEEWEKANTYNANLAPIILPDSFSIAESLMNPEREYNQCLNVTGDGMMGTVEIPKINVYLPIYHTTVKEVLEKGVGHLEGSSLPSGGENTHSVLSAHRGLPSATLFTDLDKLEIGDHFLLHILDGTLCYEVDQILVVEPTETEFLVVEDGKDYCTLLTCTPYGINTKRLLVRGSRIPYEENVIEEEKQEVVTSLHTNYLLWVIVGLAVTFVAIIIMIFVSARMPARRDRE